MKLPQKLTPALAPADVIRTYSRTSEVVRVHLPDLPGDSGVPFPETCGYVFHLFFGTPPVPGHGGQPHEDGGPVVPPAPPRQRRHPLRPVPVCSSTHPSIPSYSGTILLINYDISMVVLFVFLEIVGGLKPATIEITHKGLARDHCFWHEWQFNRMYKSCQNARIMKSFLIKVVALVLIALLQNGFMQSWHRCQMQS